jgi:hypothetical protein
LIPPHWTKCNCGPAQACDHDGVCFSGCYVGGMDCGALGHPEAQNFLHCKDFDPGNEFCVELQPLPTYPGERVFCCTVAP